MVKNNVISSFKLKFIVFLSYKVKKIYLYLEFYLCTSIETLTSRPKWRSSAGSCPLVISSRKLKSIYSNVINISWKISKKKFGLRYFSKLWSHVLFAGSSYRLSGSSSIVNPSFHITKRKSFGCCLGAFPGTGLIQKF